MGVPDMMVAAAPVFNPVLASTKAVLNLVACCSLGVVASKAGILDQAAISALSRLVFNVFQPSLLFTNVVTTLATPAPAGSRIALFVLPVFAALQIFAAAILSQVLVRAAGYSLSSEEGRELQACSTFANSGPLPLLFAETLFKGHPDQSLRPKAIAYISFYLLSWSPLFWTYGYSMLAERASDTLLRKNPDSPKPRRTVGERLRMLTSSPKFRRIVSPPTVSCTLGALTGAVPILRNLFVSETAALGPVFNAMRTMSAAYVPCVLLVLAGSLAQGMAGFDASVVRRALAVMVQRFAVMPLTALQMVNFGRSLGVIPKEPLLLFILLMQGCMPSAQNTVVILQLEKRPKAAASMARLISTVYVLSIIPIGLWLRWIMQHVEL